MGFHRIRKNHISQRRNRAPIKFKEYASDTKSIRSLSLYGPKTQNSKYHEGEREIGQIFLKDETKAAKREERDPL